MPLGNHPLFGVTRREEQTPLPLIPPTARVKFFKATSTADLEAAINDWLTKDDGTWNSIHQVTVISDVAAGIFYTPQKIKRLPT